MTLIPEALLTISDWNYGILSANVLSQIYYTYVSKYA